MKYWEISMGPFKCTWPSCPCLSGWAIGAMANDTMLDYHGIFQGGFKRVQTINLCNEDSIVVVEN
jgi:hypothetical protein